MTHASSATTGRPLIAAQADLSEYPCRSSQQHSVQGLDGGQIRALFDNCLKLASENKITAKNTWDLPLIDHLSDLVQVMAPPTLACAWGQAPCQAKICNPAEQLP